MVDNGVSLVGHPSGNNHGNIMFYIYCFGINKRSLVKRSCFDIIFIILILDPSESNHNSNSKNPKHNPTSGNPHGNPHNNSNTGPVSLYDLRHGTKNALGVEEHSVRCLLNVENWTAWRLKVGYLLDISFFK